MRVLLAATSLLSAYGGPAYSVSRLATALTKIGVQVGLWAPDRSALTAVLAADVQRLAESEAAALDKFGAELLHDNGIWLPHNHKFAKLAAKRSLPRIVSTRGMLEPRAISHRRWKKWLAWQVYQRRDLRRADCHHATGEKEAEHVRQLDLGVAVCVIPNGVDVPEPRLRGASKEQKTALYLGRIHPIKGLPMLVEAWARVRPVGWHLRIVGPDEAGHRAEVERAIAVAALGETITLAGPVEGEIKRQTFFDADLFILPTHSESFGVVIAEALAHGLPVLTTTGAPWPLLPERGCGWRVDATIEGIAKGLAQANSRETAELAAMGARGREWMIAEFSWTGVAAKFAAAYENILRHRLDTVGPHNIE